MCYTWFLSSWIESQWVCHGSVNIYLWLSHYSVGVPIGQVYTKGCFSAFKSWFYAWIGGQCIIISHGNLRNIIQRNMIGSKISTSSNVYVWLAETFVTSPLKPLNRIQWNLTGSKISTSFTKVCFFWGGGGDWQNKIAALASDWLRHFRLLLWNVWTEFIKTRQEARSQLPLPILWFSGRMEKQDGRPGLWLAKTFSTSLKLLNGIQRNSIGSKIWTSSTKIVFFRPIRKTRWPLASDWLRHFRLLWNGWTEFNETWQETRSQRPLPSLCFSGRSEKQDGRPGLWFAETFSTSSLKRSNGIQRNMIGSKISTSSTKFVFFGPIGKTRWPSWPLIVLENFHFSSETA